jgi:hypothetical protein
MWRWPHVQPAGKKADARISARLAALQLYDVVLEWRELSAMVIEPSRQDN